MSHLLSPKSGLQEDPAALEANTEYESPLVESAQKRRRTRKKTDVQLIVATQDERDGDSQPLKKRRKRIVKESEDLEVSKIAIGSLRRSSRTTNTPKLLVEDDPVNPTTQSSSLKKKRTKKIVETVIYDIPPVERKHINFKGRLGYACLNTILRNMKPVPIFCSRTCRIDTIEKNGLEYVKELGLQNTKDLYKIIEWNETNKIRFMRISSDLFPFASHEKYGFDLAFAHETLREVGELAKRLGHRLTTHPGQFTQLASPNPKVIENSVRELEYHNEMLSRMGLDQDSVMIIHMGGVYGDKEAALQRFRVNYTEKLSSDIKKRLVLENDELCYNLDDLMPICKELNIPIVIDYHHDWINPSSRPISELMPLINDTWEKKAIRVKQHLSEPRPGAETVMQKRAHADRCQSLPDALPEDIDLMIEAKDKEQAVFHLYRIYGLEEVIHENLRPAKPVEEQTLATNGRKSNRKQVLDEEME